MRNQKEARYSKDLWTKHTKYALKSKKKVQKVWEFEKKIIRMPPKNFYSRHRQIDCLADNSYYKLHD